MGPKGGGQGGASTPQALFAGRSFLRSICQCRVFLNSGSAPDYDVIVGMLVLSSLYLNIRHVHVHTDFKQKNNLITK